MGSIALWIIGYLACGVVVAGVMLAFVANDIRPGNDPSAMGLVGTCLFWPLFLAGFAVVILVYVVALFMLWIVHRAKGDVS